MDTFSVVMLLRKSNHFAQSIHSTSGVYGNSDGNLKNTVIVIQKNKYFEMKKITIYLSSPLR